MITLWKIHFLILTIVGALMFAPQKIHAEECRHTNVEDQIRCIVTEEKDIRECSFITDASLKDFCFIQIAFHRMDNDLCNQIASSKYRKDCKQRLLNASNYRYPHRIPDLACFGSKSASSSIECPKFFAQAFYEPSICELASDHHEEVLRCQASVVGSTEWFKVMFSAFTIPVAVVALGLFLLYKVIRNRKSFFIYASCIAVAAGLFATVIYSLVADFFGYGVLYLYFPMVPVELLSEYLLETFTVYKALIRSEGELLYVTFYTVAHFSSLFLIFVLLAIMKISWNRSKESE